MTAITDTYRFSGQGEDFGPRKGGGLVILHTTESEGVDMAAAKALAKWQDRDDVAGSYNRIIATDGVLSTVPDDHASGGVNPFSPYFQPVAWLPKLLPAHVIGDPNAYALQLAFMGQRATWDAKGWPLAMIDAAARSIIEEEQRIGSEVVVANHADFQPGNRTDAGVLAKQLVMARYGELMEDRALAFTDVPVDDPFRGDIEWMRDAGITAGIRNSDGTFRFEPDRPVTRKEAAAFLHRLAKYIDGDTRV